MAKPVIEDGFDRGDCTLTFADNVRVRSTPATEAAGIAGAAGQVMGETTPSVTGVSVIGTPRWDYAIAVEIPNRGDEFWLDPDLLEFVNHGAGTTFSLQGVPKTWIRNERGEWTESKIGIFQRMKRWFHKGK